MTLDYFLTNLLRDIDGLTMGYVAQFAILIVFIIQLLKNATFIKPLHKWMNEAGHPRLVALVLQVVLWGIIALGRNQGLEFGNVFETMTALANALAPNILGGFSSALIAELGYNFLVDKNVPGFSNNADA